MDEVNLEEQKLRSVINEYNICLEDLKLKYDNFSKLYSNYEEAEEERINIKNKIDTINKNINNPYFARIDFNNINENIIDKCYIGKVGIMDFDNKIITIDWRAPIASLYYDSNIGKTSYIVNDDIIVGNLTLKRQYNIENKVLISYNDVDTVSNDELLKPYLGVNCDKRLKNIVSTIQSEQNEIIRSSISNNLIIQGVAGSGKTTVALHRIAYLVYAYKDIFKTNQFMILGPNKFFINYISSVLPDLDVNGVNQFDLIQFTEKYIGASLNIQEGYTQSSKYKSSLNFKEDISNYINRLVDANLISDDDIKIKDFTLVPNAYIKNIWKDLEEKQYSSLNNKIDRAILLISKYVDDNYTNIIMKINSFFDNKKKDIDELRKDRTSMLESLKSNKNGIIRKYFVKLNMNTVKTYKDILKEKNMYEGTLYYEDIPGLLYLNYKLYDSFNYYSIKHVVIDEAQDYNQFTFLALKKIFKNATFSIYGDLAQSLYPYRSITNWNELKNNSIYNDISIKVLNKSYRTSIEIMNEANKINKILNLNLAEAVIRHGAEVEYIKINNFYKNLETSINKLIDKGLKSIAIIVKEEIKIFDIYENLNNKFNINIINKDNLEYNSGISLITSKLSKGLEFDGVIIIDLVEEKYNFEKELDLKLLYVAMTRAMHNLIVLYDTPKNILHD